MPLPAAASVTVSITRRVDPARITESGHWVEEGMNRARQYPGFLGSGWVRASEDSAHWHTLYRFTSHETLDAWESSKERAAWLAEGSDLVLEAREEKRTGIEGWFDTPQEGPLDSTGRDASAGPPPRWKQSVAIWLGLFPMNLVFALLASALVPGWDALPTVLKLLTSTLILTPIIVYFVLPWVTRLLRPWLNGRPAPSTR